jgi:hypothetical protein
MQRELLPEGVGLRVQDSPQPDMYKSQRTKELQLNPMFSLADTEIVTADMKDSFLN